MAKMSSISMEVLARVGDKEYPIGVVTLDLEGVTPLTDEVREEVYQEAIEDIGGMLELVERGSEWASGFRGAQP